ncbi:cobalt transporter ATP-binding subunit [Bacillus glycinifermentans]|uniref:Energy-coupling factor transporter ATP-binding protein EcfA2 n=1 Tax=Bacillus glycinifermentans TaxID=1664069 RepID=A0A0J6ELQ6_9BACI|nr:energy-coupling factor ABC transporter ATP-binding protein [Bacillus glycinifermentans]ATH94076.1 energy-coupling factor transporter ATPase [Bacillus glycinifermentans]KMM53234.1 cobalt transporter ATP-binding subunit [Bacillus glycinifermentans]KRT92803.1 energy-coupling factor transporter ATPase [Bacillus glycinifermentans]MEC0487216.1 energy-coupling factor ABC transporter ATP-binding protein [Bacillus glycinifermentans]MEC0497085.1 energy-coupling factor ABC transporter ATP-binding prot
MDIAIKDVEHRYQMKTPFERLALYDVNAVINEGSYVAVIGHTGSGKSTLLQHLNGLLKPTKGQIRLGEEVIEAGKKNKHLKALRKKVGIVFQFPEHQLFEETILKDIAFGPVNFGASQKQAEKKAREMLKLVGLPEELSDRSPFELSGGQMRRVAIAGVLAMEPEVLVLDEPTAGLDPRGRKEIMDMFYDLHKERKLTTILVTHSMEDAAAYADELIVMHKGTVKAKGTPRELFSKSDEIAAFGLDMPETIKFQKRLEEAFGIRFKSPILTIEEAASEIKALFQEENAYDG